jgi:hypothetical protein
MKRSLLLAIAGLVASGCYSSNTSYPASDAANVYWHWTHLAYTGTDQPLSCAQAGVDSVFIQFSDGFSETVPCSQLGVEGVQVVGFAPGTYSVSVTGYRTGQPAPLFYGTIGFTKPVGADVNVDVPAPGIYGDLTLQPVLKGWNGTAYTAYLSPACGNAAIDHVTYHVTDGAGVILATGAVACVTDPPAIAFVGTSGIDRDDLFIRLQGTSLGSIVMDSCSGAISYPHFGSDSFAIDVFGNPIPASCP